MSLLLLDHGNSRLKWGVYRQGQWLGRDGLDKDRLSALNGHWQDLSQPHAIHGVSVGPTEQRQGIEAVCYQLWGVIPQWHWSSAQLAGITNGYRDPDQLGVDRWMAMIAAYHRYGASLVVMAGTATTIDRVNDKGYFMGGLIMPGVGLMRQSLVQHTARLPWVDEADYTLQARSTEEAIYSGTLAATLGAIEQVRHGLGEATGVVLSGGYASALAPHIPAPAYFYADLVLDGLARVVSRPSDSISWR